MNEPTDEQWLPVNGFLHNGNPRYEVSTTGRIRSLMFGRGRKKRRIPIILKTRLSNKGYPSISLERKQVFIHRVMAEAFLGKCPSGMECAHLDGNPRNCTLKNIRYVSRKENHSHKIAHGTHRMGDRHPLAKLVESDVILIKSHPKFWGINVALGRKFNVKPSTISAIRTGVNWSHL